MSDFLITFRPTRPKAQRALAALSTVLMLTTLLVGAQSSTANASTSATDATIATQQMPSTSIASTTAANFVKTAVNPSQFKPGNIISDANFYNGDAMSEAEIQSFLSAMIGNCNNSLCLNILTQDTYSRAADRNICNAYAGAANESAARVIYKVQKACGISAKVILVTLQKEMALVTSKGPSQWAVDHALGYACPDTAPCDSTKSGFYNQIYLAAWQFKRYSTPTPWGSYQPGWRNIQFHPNTSCGSSSVYIENNATAALYNYTPYQPTAGAVAAYPGAAPPCGSYGNRNFWFFYNNWFGPSAYFDGAGKIAAAYQAAGGPTGSLGEVVSPRACSGSATSCYQEYENGMIGWTYAAGAYPVLGDAYVKYVASGGISGPLKYPVGSEVAISGPNGDGHSQAFQGGQILRSVGGTFLLRTQMLNELAKHQWVRGALGWPVADQLCASSSTCAQQFQHGVIGSTSSSALFAVMGVTGQKYIASGGTAGPLGYPAGEETVIESPNGDGFSQAFQGGQIVRTNDTPIVLRAAMLAKLAQHGWVRGPLGWPTADQECVSSGECAQVFQHGAIVAVSANMHHVVMGSNGDKYIASGGTAGPLGYPAGAETAIESPNGNGFSQAFRGGQILRSSAGTFIISTTMLTELAKYGWVRGSVGWPTAEQVCDSVGCSQTFQNATIVIPNSGAAYVVDTGPIGTKYTASGGVAGPMGIPAGVVVPIASPNGAGFSQAFAGGQILHSASGTYLLRTAMLTELAKHGWVRGALGWPTADQSCDSTGCSQNFQNGKIVAPTSGPAYVVDNSPIGVKYAATGGSSGPLGAPTGDTVPIVGPNGDGFSRAFQGGQILSSETGTYVLRAAMLTELAKYGWVRGSLGWPTADQVCAGADCTQNFQHGQIRITPSGVVVTHS